MLMSLRLKMLILFQKIIDCNLKQVENKEYTLHTHSTIRIITKAM